MKKFIATFALVATVMGMQAQNEQPRQQLSGQVRSQKAHDRRSHDLDETYRIDLIVEDKVIVECKAVDRHNPVFAAQLLTYLRITGLRLGVVVNFGADRIVNGFERVVNNL